MRQDLDRIEVDLRARDGEVRLAAARRLEQTLAEQLDAGRTDWEDVTGRLLPALTAGLGDADKGVQVHCAHCLQFLAYQSVDVLPALRAALHPPGARAAWGAAIVFARLGLWSDEVGQALGAAMGSADRDVRWAAAGFALSLGRAHPAAVAMVKDVLGGPAPRARTMAAYCLGAMGEYADVADELAGRLADPERDVRRAAILALRRLPHVPPAVQRRVAALRQDPDPFVRRTADAVAARWGL